MKLFGRHLVSEKDMLRYKSNEKIIQKNDETIERLKNQLNKATIIRFRKCWVCGKTNEETKITEHHGIPQHLKPLNNLNLPVCRKCHDKIHFDDIRGMYSYIFKIEKTLKDSERSIRVLKKMLDENNKLKKIRKGDKVSL